MMARDAIMTYLVNEGMVRSKSLVNGNTFMIENNRRHNTYRVVSNCDSSYFIKQGTTKEKRSAIEHEAKVYHFLRRDSRCNEIRPFVPEIVKFDSDKSLLMLDYVKNTASLREIQIQSGEFNQTIAGEIGEILSLLHAIPPPAKSVTGVTPWILSISSPHTSLFHELSNGALQLVKTIQQFDGFKNNLSLLKTRWVSGSLIHFDLKSDNILIKKGREAKRQKKVQLIDWELATIGDPCWDVGCVFGDYLSYWLLSMVYIPGSSMERLAESAKFPLEKIQPAIGSFWNAYASRLNRSKEEMMQFLNRSTEFAAAKLIQTLLEQARMNQHITGLGPYILQVSLNMLKKPVEACRQLLGISTI